MHVRQLDASANFDIPGEIVDAWKHAVQTKSKAAKNSVFQAFLRSGKDWSKFLKQHLLVSMQHMLYIPVNKDVMFKITVSIPALH